MVNRKSAPQIASKKIPSPKKSIWGKVGGWFLNRLLPGLIFLAIGLVVGDHYKSALSQQILALGSQIGALEEKLKNHTHDATQGSPPGKVRETNFPAHPPTTNRPEI